MTQSSNEKELIIALSQGSHNALEVIMDTYHHSLCIYIYSLTHDNEKAKDIVQNVFLKLWERRDRLTTIDSLKSFLYKSVYNGFLNQLRSDKKMLAIEEKHMHHLYQAIDDDEELLEKQIRIIKTEIQKLPPKCKETFILSKKEGLTNVEIASFMNVSIKTVENQMSKAFKILRNKLEHKVEPILFIMYNISIQRNME